jgi:capsular polysaccharide biosynthesis protein
MVASHGAGMTNALFLPDRAVVIEIFPFYIYMDAYQRMATQTGLLYYPIFSNIRSPFLSWMFNTGQDNTNETIRCVLFL